MKQIIVYLLIISSLSAQESPIRVQYFPKKQIELKTTNNTNFWETSYSKAIEKAKQENKPIFIMLTTEHCGWCDKLEETTLSSPEIQSFLDPFVKVQVYCEKDEEGKKIYEKLQGRGFPTLVFMDSNENILNQWSGYREPINFALECAKVYIKAKIEQPVNGFQIKDIQINIRKE